MMVKKDLLITGLTQDQLAEKLDVSQSLISKWFSGKVIPRPVTIKRICSVCDVTEKEFIDYIYEKHNRINEDKNLV
jgi:transcriptional regulator with XRE-family HTH domain